MANINIIARQPFNGARSIQIAPVLILGFPCCHLSIILRLDRFRVHPLVWRLCLQISNELISVVNFLN